MSVSVLQRVRSDQTNDIIARMCFIVFLKSIFLPVFEYLPDCYLLLLISFIFLFFPIFVPFQEFPNPQLPAHFSLTPSSFQQKYSLPSSLSLLPCPLCLLPNFFISFVFPSFPLQHFSHRFPLPFFRFRSLPSPSIRF